MESLKQHPYREALAPVPKAPPPPKLSWWGRFKHVFVHGPWAPILLDLGPRIAWVQNVTPDMENGARATNPLVAFQVFSSESYNDGTGVMCMVCGHVEPFERWSTDEYFTLSKITRGMIWTLHERLRLPCRICGLPAHECDHRDEVLRGFRVRL